MAAHKHFFNKIESNLRYTRFTLAVVPKRGSEWRGPTPRLTAPVQHSSEVRRNVAAVASRWL